MNRRIDRREVRDCAMRGRHGIGPGESTEEVVESGTYGSQPDSQPLRPAGMKEEIEGRDTGTLDTKQWNIT